MSPELTLLASVMLPFAATAVIAVLKRWPNLREAVSLLTAAALTLLAVSLLRGMLQGARPAIELIELLPGLSLELALEPLGMLFALVASFLWLVTTVYSIGYLRHHREWHQTRFYAFFALALGSTMGIAFAGNLLTLFVFYELLTLFTYPLVTHAGTDAARDGGRVYLGFLIGTSVLFLLAIVWTWSLAGTLEFRSGGILGGVAAPLAAGALLFLYLFGIGKAALMPLHRWLPAAMVAPTPVSALLHAVAVVKAGVFTVLKVSVYIFGTDFLATIPATQWLMYIAAATVLFASIIALRQDNLKLRLAYSTISQLGYIVLCAMLANPLGVAAGGMHIVMHAFAKITLFFCAGAIIITTHKTRLSEMDGIGRRMPVTMGAFFVASLGIIGLPPLGGFWSKWFIGMAALDSGQLLMLAVVLLGSLLSTAYLLPIPLRAFFGSARDESEYKGVQEAPLACLVPLVLTAVACVSLFAAPEAFYRFMQLLMLQQG